MTEHPIERLRNKLTPFFTMAMIAKVAKIKFENEQEEKIFKESVALCNESIEEVRHWLSVAENAIPNEYPTKTKKKNYDNRRIQS